MPTDVTMLRLGIQRHQPRRIRGMEFLRPQVCCRDRRQRGERHLVAERQFRKVIGYRQIPQLLSCMANALSRNRLQKDLPSRSLWGSRSADFQRRSGLLPQRDRRSQLLLILSCIRATHRPIFVWRLECDLVPRVFPIEPCRPNCIPRLDFTEGRCKQIETTEVEYFQPQTLISVM